MKITVDTREKPNVLIIMKQLGIPTTRKTMSCGDFETLQCIAERKTVRDLIGSIQGKKVRGQWQSGRLWDQMNRMKTYADEHNKIPFLFVSGSIDNTIAYMEGRGIKVNEHSIMGALTSVAVRYGIHVFALFSTDRKMLYCMNSAFEKVRDGKYGLPHRTPMQRNKNKKVALWMTILRCRASIAKALIKKYGGVDKFLIVLKRNPDKLTVITGVGPATVTKWKKLLL